MEILVLLAIVVLVIIWAATRGMSARREAGTVKTRPSEPKITVPIQTTPSSSFDNPDTGPVTATSDGGWVLNPKSTFPLTVYGIDRATAEDLKRLLDQGYSLGTYDHARALVPLIARSNLRCKEVDEYIRRFKPQYLKTLEELKRSSGEWASASEPDREDLLSTFRQQAIDSLEVRPAVCDLETLFESEPLDTTIDDALIDRFGFETLQLYLRYAGNLAKVHVIPADHYDRDGFEKLVKVGLAIRGAEIPLSGILETLKLKDLKELVADLHPPSFRRKAQAIDFLMKLPDVKEGISKVVAFRELFQLKPLPAEFSHIDLDQISASWSCAHEIATLIAHTYVVAGYATCKRQYQDDLSYITGWELSSDETSCPYCKCAAAKAYPKTQRPKVPLHIGCRCSVLPKLRE